MAGPATAKSAALDYLGRGWSVVPVRPASKLPFVLWQEYQFRQPTEAELEHWFTHWRNAGVAIVTGQISNLVVIDIDPRHGGDDSLDALEREHGPLPPTITALTGGGGRHLYFLAPATPIPLRNRVGIRPGIDLRAEGGLIVAPPSTHPSGRRYRWAPGRDPDSVEAAPLPAWLIRLAGSGGASASRHTLEHWRLVAREGVAEGERNSVLASFSGYLLWHGVDDDVVLELMLCWNAMRCRPPLPEAEVVRTVESIIRTHRGHEGDFPHAGLE